MNREERMKAILSHPAYVRADLDLDWVGSHEMRGTRLLLEYTKPQTAFTRLNVRSTIVMFGSARIIDPDEARVKLEDARAAAEPASDAPAVRRAERLLHNSRYYSVSRDFARLVSERYQTGEHRDLVVITGGGPGIMEAGNRGAYDAGRHSIGLNIELPFEQEPNSYITPDLCFNFRYFAIRKMHFLAAARALVAFPGGYGTFDEFFEALCLIQTQVIGPLPVVLVGEEFWKKAFDAEFLADEGVISPQDVDLFSYAETAEDIHEQIVSWYKSRRIDPWEGTGPYSSW